MPAPARRRSGRSSGLAGCRFPPRSLRRFPAPVAAALVIGVGLDAGLARAQARPPHAAGQAAAIDDLAARIAGVESKTSKPAAAGARSGRGRARRGAGKIAGRVARRARRPARAVGEARGQCRRRQIGAARIRCRAGSVRDQRAHRTRSSAPPARRAPTIAQAGATKPADDVPLRRIVAAALLDVLGPGRAIPTRPRWRRRNRLPRIPKR